MAGKTVEKKVEKKVEKTVLRLVETTVGMLAVQMAYY